MSWRSLEDVMKTPSVFFWQDVFKRSWRRYENAFSISWKRMTKKNILVLIKTSSEDVWVTWIYSSWSRRLEEVLWIWRRKKFSGCLQDVFIKMNICWEARWNLLLQIGSSGMFHTIWFQRFQWCPKIFLVDGSSHPISFW